MTDEPDTLPTKSCSSTKWSLDQLIFLEDCFGDSKTLRAGIDDIISETHPAALPELMNNILYYIDENESLEESLDAQIRALTESRDRFKKQAENLRETMKHVFNKFSLTKLICPLGTVSRVTKTASKLVIEDESAILMQRPDLFTKQAPKLNKILLIDELKAGGDIEGAKLVDSTTIAVRK